MRKEENNMTRIILIRPSTNESTKQNKTLIAKNKIAGVINYHMYIMGTQHKEGHE